MWKIVRSAVDGASVVAIGTFPTYASLFFYRGRELDDGSGLLEGGGKQLRFLRLRAPADAARPAVKRLVRKAFTLGGRTRRLGATPLSTLRATGPVRPSSGSRPASRDTRGTPRDPP